MSKEIHERIFAPNGAEPLCFYPQNIDNTYYVLREMFAVATIQL